MKTYMDQLVYEAYAQHHHRHLLDIAGRAPQIMRPATVPEAPFLEPKFQPTLRYHLAYVLAMLILFAITVTRAVAAVVNLLGGGGGGANLVK